MNNLIKKENYINIYSIAIKDKSIYFIKYYYELILSIR